MSTYHDEIAEQTATLRRTVSAIADAMPGWEMVTPHDHNAQLVGPDGVTIWTSVVTYGASKGRLTLSAGVPSDANYSAGDYSGLERPEITVSPTRPVSTLVKDVNRRLIPAAVGYWQEVSGRVARRLSAQNNRETLARELAGLMGTRASEWRDEYRTSMPTGLYGDMIPRYDGDSVKLEISNLPADRARELARLIGSWSA